MTTAFLQVIGDGALLLLVGLMVAWVVRRAATRSEPRPRPLATARSNWRRRALWFATWWTLPG
jgi:hypothetical protein